MKNKTTELLEKYPQLREQIEEIIEDEKFKHLVPMHDCECGGKHDDVDGVLYRLCSKCRGLHCVRDEEFIKRRGELPVDKDWE